VSVRISLRKRYEQIYNESSELWKRDVTLDQSNEVFKTLRAKLGKVESRALHSAAEQQNSGGALKGHVYIPELPNALRTRRWDGDFYINRREWAVAAGSLLCKFHRASVKR
jgi:hypothetical protein